MRDIPLPDHLNQPSAYASQSYQPSGSVEDDLRAQLAAEKRNTYIALGVAALAIGFAVWRNGSCASRVAEGERDSLRDALRSPSLRGRYADELDYLPVRRRR